MSVSELQALLAGMSIDDDPFDGMKLEDCFCDATTSEFRHSCIRVSDHDYELFLARASRIRLLRPTIPPLVWDEIKMNATSTSSDLRQRMDEMAANPADRIIYNVVSDEFEMCLPADRTFGESAAIACRLVMIVMSCDMY